jgi:dsDNA-specific endonuclease/ATPase MutS2
MPPVIPEHPISDTLDLHTFAARDVKIVVEEYLHHCAQRKFKHVRIIHGKGIGAQREIVRSILRKSPFVESFGEGPDWGSTAVVLKS